MTPPDWLSSFLKSLISKKNSAMQSTRKNAGGYDVISAIGEIATLTDQDVKFDVSPPTTIKKGNEYLTEMWFWGAHNCELHKFSLTVNGSEIKHYEDGVLGKFGSCHPLAYE
jgi:hypothetical protein